MCRGRRRSNTWASATPPGADATVSGHPAGALLAVGAHLGGRVDNELAPLQRSPERLNNLRKHPGSEPRHRQGSSRVMLRSPREPKERRAGSPGADPSDHFPAPGSAPQAKGVRGSRPPRALGAGVDGVREAECAHGVLRGAGRPEPPGALTQLASARSASTSRSRSSSTVPVLGRSRRASSSCSSALGRAAYRCTTWPRAAFSAARASRLTSRSA